jgi:uncharacterized protein YjbI with pentapeptide repeats
MKQLQRLLNRFISTETHITRLNGSNTQALDALYTLHERLFLQQGGLRGMAFTDADWTNATLATIKLEGCNLQNIRLCFAYLYETQLQGAHLAGADLSDANARAAHLERANLTGSKLARTNLARADLTGAILHNAILDETNLWNAILYGADLSGATLRGVNLTHVKFDATSILPDGSPWSPQRDVSLLSTG